MEAVIKHAIMQCKLLEKKNLNVMSRTAQHVAKSSHDFSAIIPEDF